MLLQDEAQVGLVRAVYHQDVETRGLIEDELVLVSKADHELAGLGAVTVEQLGDHPFIFFERNSSYYSLAQGLFRQHGVVPRTQMELDSMEASKKMVEEGLGIALLPRMAVERELGTGELREIEIVGMPNPIAPDRPDQPAQPPARPRSAGLRRNRPGNVLTRTPGARRRRHLTDEQPKTRKALEIRGPFSFSRTLLVDSC